MNTILLIFFFSVLALGFFMLVKPESNLIALSILPFFIIAFALAFTHLLSDFHSAQKPLQKFLSENQDRIIAPIHPTASPTELVTEDFGHLSGLKVEQEQIQEPAYGKTINALSERALFYRQQLGVEYLRDQQGILERQHFNIDSVGSSPFIFEFVVPMSDKLILAPDEESSLAQVLPEEIKGFQLTHRGDIVSVRAVIDEKTVGESPRESYDALVKTKKMLI